MSDSMVKLNHKMIAEHSIYNFIDYLEKDTGEAISDRDREWLLEKGAEIFEAYYIDNLINIGLTSKEDKDKLEGYFEQVQSVLGKMFAHIMLAEYKLFLIIG